MHFAVMYRSAAGVNHLQKEIYRSLDDAEEGVVESNSWLASDCWQRLTQNSSIFNLNDGSCFFIYQEE